MIDHHDLHRPVYHFTAPRGWLNDPNGLVDWQGQYHLFYQANPAAPRHREISWGHASSQDLVHWTSLPIALTPDATGPDRHGCWSGVLVDDDGTPTIVYSGHDGEQQLPCLAVGDSTLTAWRKEPANPVIASRPEPDVTEFRDHCIWKDGAVWNQLIGGGLWDRGGAVFLYQSGDLRTWRYRGPAAVGDANRTEPIWTGSVWECPDLFHIDGAGALVVSAWNQGTTHYSVVFPAELDTEAGQLTLGEPQLLDLGRRHFYAPQSFQDRTGRRMMIGWMQEGIDQERLDRQGWAGVLSVPRVLGWRDHILVQAPAEELASLRRDEARLDGTPVGVGERISLGPNGRALDIELNLRLGRHSRVELELLASPDHREVTRVVIDRMSQEVRLDRRHSSIEPSDNTVLRGHVALGDRVHLRALIDHSALELFVNGIPLTARVYPSLESSTGLAISVNGDPITIESGSIWHMDAAIFSPSVGDN